MPVVNVQGWETALGAPVVGDGLVTVQYWAGAGPYISVAGDDVVFPALIRIPVEGGAPTVPVDVPGTGGVCCVRWEFLFGVHRLIRYTTIPAVGPVDFGDLPQVDPATFEPSDEVLTAWLAVVGEVTGLRDEAVTAATEASADASAAGSSAFSAGASAAAAQSSEDDAETAATAAAGSASAAAGSASAAAGSAASAATSASTATAQAGVATTAAGDADADRIAAQTARTDAQTARTGAESARTGAEAARDLALAGQFSGAALGTTSLDTIGTPGVYRQSDAAEATLARGYPVTRPGVLTVVSSGGGSILMQEYRTTKDASESVRGVYVRRIIVGSTIYPWRFMPSQTITSPGGQPGVEVKTWDDVNGREQALLPVGFRLDTVNLNDINLPGVYYQDVTANSTFARNYPVEGVGVALEVVRISATNMVQRLNVIFGSGPNASVGFFQRRINGATFGPWGYFAIQRVDQTAGRAFYNHDNLNFREQLTYGDTGIRDVTSLLINGWTAAGVYLIREGYTGVLAVEGLNAAAKTDDKFIDLPAGFRPAGIVALSRGLLHTAAAPAVAVRAFVSNTSIQLHPPGGVGLLYGSLRYRIAEAWPTALPGTAVGSIPNL